MNVIVDNGIFTQGIDPGGLTQEYEVKFLICYIMYTINKPLTFDDINYVLQSTAVVNYFEYSQAFNKLIELGQIEVLEKDNFILSQSGRDVATTFDHDLPKAIKDKTILATKDYLERKEHEKNNKVSIDKVDDGYKIELSINDLGSDLMTLSLFMPNKDYCNIIKENFYKSPTTVYLKILEALTNE